MTHERRRSRGRQTRSNEPYSDSTRDVQTQTEGTQGKLLPEFVTLYHAPRRLRRRITHTRRAAPRREARVPRGDSRAPFCRPSPLGPAPETAAPICRQSDG